MRRWAAQSRCRALGVLRSHPTHRGERGMRSCFTFITSPPAACHALPCPSLPFPPRDSLIAGSVHRVTQVMHAESAVLLQRKGAGQRSSTHGCELYRWFSCCNGSSSAWVLTGGVCGYVKTLSILRVNSCDSDDRGSKEKCALSWVLHFYVTQVHPCIPIHVVTTSSVQPCRLSSI